MGKWYIVALLLLLVQAGLTYLQLKSYQRRVAELKHLGILSVGSQKGRIGAGSIVIMVVDEQGQIVTCEEMKGRTVFARFKEREDLKGMRLDEARRLREQLLAKDRRKRKKRDSMLSAIEAAQNRLANRSEELNTT